MYSLLTRREDMLLARAAARAARAALAARFTTTADIATCLDPLPEQRAHSPLIFDPLQFPFDEGAAASVDTPPLCGVIDDFLTEEECGRLIALSTSRGYESVNATIQHGDVPAPKKGSKMSDRGLNLSGRVLIESERFAELLWERLAPMKALWAPSLKDVTHYQLTKEYFAKAGIKTHGFVQWADSGGGSAYEQ